MIASSTLFLLLAINPWASFAIVALAFGGALYALYSQKMPLAIGLAGVGFLFGAISTGQMSNALQEQEQRIESLRQDIELKLAQQQAALQDCLSEKETLAASIQKEKEAKEKPQKTNLPPKAKTSKSSAKTPAKKPVANKKTLVAKAGVASKPLSYNYSQQGRFRSGLAPVKGKNGKWGYVDRSGREVVPCYLRMACELHCGLGAVRQQDGKWGYVNAEGKLAIPYAYDDVMAFEEDTKQALVRFNGYWLWLNTNGEIVREAKASEVRARKKVAF